MNDPLCLDTSLSTRCDTLPLESNQEASLQPVSSPVCLNKDCCFLFLTSWWLFKSTP